MLSSGRRALIPEPDHSLHVEDEVGEADFGPRAGNTDGADEQAHRPFRRAKTCSTAERTADLRALARAVRRGIGLPFGFLRWICERNRRSARNFSFAFER